MKRCGVLGEKLGHSYSPAIHAELADYEYRLYEVAPEKLGEFLTGGGFDGMNVTIPYKKAVIPYCAELSPIAQKLKSVNVLIRRENGTRSRHRGQWAIRRALPKQPFRQAAQAQDQQKAAGHLSSSAYRGRYGAAADIRADCMLRV